MYHPAKHNINIMRNPGRASPHRPQGAPPCAHGLGGVPRTGVSSESPTWCTVNVGWGRGLPRQDDSLVSKPMCPAIEQRRQLRVYRLEDHGQAPKNLVIRARFIDLID